MLQLKNSFQIFIENKKDLSELIKKSIVRNRLTVTATLQPKNFNPLQLWPQGKTFVEPSLPSRAYIPRVLPKR